MTGKFSRFQNILCSYFIFNLVFSPLVFAAAKGRGQINWRKQNNINSEVKIRAVFNENQIVQSPANQSASASIIHLAQVMDYFHSRFPVYEDVSSAGNHFHVYTKIPDGNAPVTINGSWTNNPHSGATAIRGQLLTNGGPFGGFYFQNGILPAGETVPQPNFGTVTNAGILELANATSLTFWARGEVGGENIDFFMGGVGYKPETGAVLSPCTPDFPEPCPAPDSTPRIPAYNTPPITLTTDWQQYTIPLTGADLSYVLGGFGWVASLANNPTGATFYIDDIQYQLNSIGQSQRLNQPRFLRSFITRPFQLQPPPVNDFDLVLRNAAFTYDNALVLLAFLADGTEDSLRRAKLIGDALVYASQHDRFYNAGQFRNAYAAGDISLPPGWTPNKRIGTVPVSGFYNEKTQKFVEIEQNSIDTGNNAWAMIALLALYRRFPNQSYLDAARRIGLFLETFKNINGTYRGFQGGLENYPESPNVTRRIYASTEHNEDLVAGYTALFKVTGEVRWQIDTQHARQFVEAMWESQRGCYLAGTTNPETRNTNPGQLPLDVQAWSLLALPETLTIHPQVLNCAEQNHRTSADGFNGFDFNDDRDGVWFEGTAQMATAYSLAGQRTAAESLRTELQRAQQTAPFGNGFGIAAASREGLTTGFQLSDGAPFLYFRRLHIGATAWNVFAQKGINPYYLFLKNSYDFDGDGKTDISVFRPSNSVWYLLRSQLGFTASEFGISTDLISPADYDGDGKTDIAVFRASKGTWYRLNSSDGIFNAVQFGVNGDLPRPGDFDGDGKADICVFRPSNGFWYRLNSSNGQFHAVQFGVNGDAPVIADFDGDGKSDIAVFRPANGVWYWLNSSKDQFSAVQFGQSGDIPSVGDFDGDGKSDISVFRPSNGSWYRLNSASGQFAAVQFGVSEDIPTVGDFDGDGKSDIAVFRPSSGVWYLLQSQSGFTGVQFGISSDKPIPSAFLP